MRRNELDNNVKTVVEMMKATPLARKELIACDRTAAVSACRNSEGVVRRRATLSRHCQRITAPQQLRRRSGCRATLSQHCQRITAPQQFRRSSTAQSNFILALPTDHRTTATPKEKHGAEQLYLGTANGSPHHSNSEGEAGAEQLYLGTANGSPHHSNSEGEAGAEQLYLSTANGSPHHSNSEGVARRRATLSRHCQRITAPQQLRRRSGCRATLSQHCQRITAPQQFRRSSTAQSNFILALPTDHRTTATPKEKHGAEQLYLGTANGSPHHSNSEGEAGAEQLYLGTANGSPHHSNSEGEAGAEQLYLSTANGSPHHSNSEGVARRRATLSWHCQRITAPQQLRRRSTAQSNFISALPTDHRTTATPKEKRVQSNFISALPTDHRTTATPKEKRVQSNFISALPTDHRTTATPKEKHGAEQLYLGTANGSPHDSNSEGVARRRATLSRTT
ncbi:hypothetical protein Aduo_010025 [Ancylostoma duodenale]